MLDIRYPLFRVAGCTKGSDIRLNQCPLHPKLHVVVARCPEFATNVYSSIKYHVLCTWWIVFLAAFLLIPAKNFLENFVLHLPMLRALKVKRQEAFFRGIWYTNIHRNDTRHTCKGSDKNVESDKRQKRKTLKSQTSEATNVVSYKRRKRQTSKNTNIGSDKRPKRLKLEATNVQRE